MIIYAVMAQSAASDLAVTGLGCISGLGVGRVAFERGLFGGQRAYGPVHGFDTREARSHLAGRIDAFDPAAFIAPEKLRRIDRIGQLAIAGCRLALEDADLRVRAGVGAGDVGVVLGTATAGLHTLVGYLDRLWAQGPSGASALDFSNTVGNAAASLCGLEFGLRGINATVAQKEASACAAIAHAASVLRAGRHRAVVTGGVDDFEGMYFAVHDRFGALARDEGAGEASRPFDRRRNGFVLGCGAFLVVLESAASAVARRARPLCRLAGSASTSAPCRLHSWPSDPAELVRCMRDALADAGFTPRDVAVVFASANSSRDLDRVEAEAIKAVFGPSGVPVVAVKGSVGECGAAGAAAFTAAVFSLQRRLIPPTLGFEVADPDCAVDVRATPRPLDPGRAPIALVNSFASGGANVSLVVTT
jgi:3-oxoacyl-[acyl-carrier-protein] synthase II